MSAARPRPLPAAALLAALLLGCGGGGASPASPDLAGSNGGRARAPAGGVVTGSRVNISYGRHELQKFDFHHPLAGEPPHPLVIHLHEGAFVGGDKKLPPNQGLHRAIREAGAAVASANYRLAPEATFPEPALDAARMVQYMRAHADTFQIDPDRIVLMGRSAGSVLAGWVTYGPDQADPDATEPVLRQSSRPLAWVNFSGVTDFEAIKKTMECAYFGPETIYHADLQLIRDASPLHLALLWNASPPPSFSWYCGRKEPVPTNDPHNPVFGDMLEIALRSLGDTESVNVWSEIPGDDPPVEDVIAWLERVWGR